MKSIGKYQVVEELGSSPAGQTYHTRDTFRHREFAIKILPVVPGLTAEAKEKFCDHLASCAELSHRQIAKITDLGEVEEGIFVASEWRVGMDLRRFMEENRELALDQKLGMMAQVAEGLAFAHSRGIPHGNLKPSNIFVDQARDVTVLDFGSAKWLAALLAAGERPEGLIANYLAPEQVLGQPFDAKSDIFALGLMVYEFASGHYPFKGDAGLIPREIVHGQAELLRKVSPNAPEELEQLIVRAFEKNPEQRLQTAEEFASGLYLAARKSRRSAAAPGPVSPVVEAAVVEVPAVPAPLPAIVAPEVAAAPVAPTPIEIPVNETPAPTLARTPEPQTAFAMDTAPPVRERPQDAESEQKPWTARSYAATSLPPVNAESAKKPASQLPPPPPPASDSTPDKPAFVPPKSFLQAPPMPKLPIPKKAGGTGTGKRVAIIVAGLILAIAIAAMFLSRQNLRASQKAHAVTAAPEPIVQAAKPAPPPPPAPVQQAKPEKHEDPPDAPVNPEVSAKQILNGPVRTLWESGRYAQAMAMVNQVLTTDPNNEDARSWKKKIREAQAAEAALK
jgi:eukaryotic-like serine/threonine-protein kinase